MHNNKEPKERDSKGKGEKYCEGGRGEVSVRRGLGR